jgi:hypothetical protein
MEIKQEKLYKDMLYKEQAVLRAELGNLKNCQITFLTFTVTGSGLLFTFAANVVTSESSPFPQLGIFFLIPLIVILPFWWVFFDKATTITRIVGYYRVLEMLILDPTITASLKGWENALAHFRKDADHEAGSPSRQPITPTHRTIKSKAWSPVSAILSYVLPEKTNQEDLPQQFLRLVALQTSHKYWVITYYTFSALALLAFFTCLFALRQETYAFHITLSLATLGVGLCIGALRDRAALIAVLAAMIGGPIIFVVLRMLNPPIRFSVAVLIITALVVGLSLSRNAIIILRLTWGEYSYEHNHAKWRGILGIPPEAAPSTRAGS